MTPAIRETETREGGEAGERGKRQQKKKGSPCHLQRICPLE
jgi:hypothetical protein